MAASLVDVREVSVRPDEVRTYAALWQNAQKIAAWLVGRGLARGERFGLMMRNHPEFVEMLAAASITAGVAVLIDPRTRGDKLACTLRNGGCVGNVCFRALHPVRATR